MDNDEKIYRSIRFKEFLAFFVLWSVFIAFVFKDFLNFEQNFYKRSLDPMGFPMDLWDDGSSFGSDAKLIGLIVRIIILPLVLIVSYKIAEEKDLVRVFVLIILNSISAVICYFIFQGLQILKYFYDFIIFYLGFPLLIIFMMVSIEPRITGVIRRIQAYFS